MAAPVGRLRLRVRGLGFWRELRIRGGEAGEERLVLSVGVFALTDEE